MIFSAFILFAVLIIKLFVAMLGLLTFIFPTQFFDAIEYFVQGTNLLKGIFPVQTLMSSFATLLLFWTIWYTFKLIIWIIKFIPGLHHVTHPHETMQRETDTISKGPYGTYRSKSTSKYRKGK